MTLQSNDNNKTTKTLGIHDTRALMAVVARLIAGFILALMFHQYFSTQGTGAAFVQSRVWWEIILNLQLLAIGMMWFSYSDRVTSQPGRLRKLQMARRWLAIFAVSTPAALAIVGVFRDWFTTRPGAHALVIVSALAVVHLAVSLRIYKSIEEYRVSKKHVYTRQQRIIFFMPSILFLALVAVDLPTGGMWWFILLPFMVFLQGAMPYIFETVGLKQPEVYV